MNNKLWKDSKRKEDSLVGKKFERLTVLSEAPKKNYTAARQWKCLCACGKEVISETNALRRGATKSCGCWRKDRMGNFSRKHGLEGTPIYILYQTAKKRAKKKGMDFTIQLSDMPIIPDKCPIFGIPLKHSVISGKASSNSPSLDRIDNSKGYIVGNIRIISYRANILKNNATTQELYLLYKDSLSLNMSSTT